MFPAQLTTLATEEDGNVNASVHTSEFSAYVALLVELLGDPALLEASPVRSVTLAAYHKALNILFIADDSDDTDDALKFEPLREFLQDYIENRDIPFTFTITRHDLQASFDADIAAVKALAKTS